MTEFRNESDSLGVVRVPSDMLWGAQTQRALNLFTIGHERMPREMITPYAILKKGCAQANHAAGTLPTEIMELIVRVCDEIIDGRHRDMFPLPVWISGSGTQFNMNVNEVIANRCSQLAGESLGSKKPVHPNDHVNKSQSTNDNFPSVMHMSVVIETFRRLLPSLRMLKDHLSTKAKAWMDIVKIGRTHMQDATPLTLGQEFSGYAAMLEESLYRLDAGLGEVYALPLGGTAVGTGINTSPGFGEDAIANIAELTGLPFVPVRNIFAAQGSHDALVHFSGLLKTLAVSLNKIASDIRLLACGPRAGIGELILPANEPGSSIMPGKVNPTQVEALTMVSLQVIVNDQAVSLGGTSGALEMNAYKPLMIRNLLHSIGLLVDAMDSFRINLVDGLEPNRERISDHLNRSLMLVTALAPAIGYESAASIAHHAHETGQTLKESALELGLVTEKEFDQIMVPEKMTRPHD
ncbi:class II fumarate hydratase [Pseudodesulfovibrio sediminis]|uniref:Fumarate hydratase class II n=1 Tax=Pseudodesulfovibrio sediminis TaxID=2810563 RepID=A0ABM7P7K9_9BACT|nr:class II fumarate hydratase [Pseudodesulfovibrio sediminis]BCS88974.1 fumarate hydratase class II 2 [Pseudodesulfovibrio sediminis]